MHYGLLTLVLAPVLLVQGISTRARVPKLQEPPGPREGQKGNGDPLRLLVAGDSAAAGVGASHQDEALLGQIVSRLQTDFRVTWNLQARTGYKTSAVLSHLEALPSHSLGDWRKR